MCAKRSEIDVDSESCDTHNCQFCDWEGVHEVEGAPSPKLRFCQSVDDCTVRLYSRISRERAALSSSHDFENCWCARPAIPPLDLRGEHCVCISGAPEE